MKKRYFPLKRPMTTKLEIARVLVDGFLRQERVVYTSGGLESAWERVLKNLDNLEAMIAKRIERAERYISEGDKR